MIIEIKNLVKRYKDNYAVNGVDLSIEEGEIFGLLGPNGAGKSTTLNALIGLITCTEGSIEIFGKKFTGAEREIRREIGYVPQDLAFFEELSALDNVTYWGKLYGLRGKELKESVKEALERTGLWDRRKEQAKKYSGGMKRRLNIACAIVHHPKILLMDEPTVGVDPQSRNSILDSIRELNQGGTTVIYTSHYMEEIEAICSKVAIMDFGKIIALGTVEELIASSATTVRMSLHFRDPEKALQMLREHKAVISCERREGALDLTLKQGDWSFSSLVTELSAAGHEIIGAEIEKASLESVFLKLTGKKLRD
ncbi:MAG: ABC transporter ATP-binding protein [Ruminococcaceae bacterium]|nr:ABC transporter ATP-binding protein [Oscillospiraceae bacterium]